jgi:ATP-dependent helicase/nuclease subunit B
MPHLFTVAAHEPIARVSARHILATYDAATLGNSILLLPNRRACVVMRDAWMHELRGKTALLPRMIPLADIENELIGLMGDAAFAALANIPQAMPEAEQRYILTQQVMAYERKRISAPTIDVTVDYALTLADTLMQLQEQCVRAGVGITQEKLRQLFYSDYADHWRDALLFLGILTDTWPQIEQAYGQTTRANREVMMLQALANHWQHHPAEHPVICIGSTASQPATAMLLKSIAEMPGGKVILPGLDVAMPEADWQAIAAGHPLFHMKRFLAQWPLTPDKVTPLSEQRQMVWLEALAPTPSIVDWSTRTLPEHGQINLIPCAHAEEEARVISLLLREGLENPEAHSALITPDEGLLARVATHMQRYGITVDRLSAGNLANTQTGSAWVAMSAAIQQPESLLRLRELLHHPLLGIDSALLQGLEQGWYGLNRKRAGDLPRHDASLSAHADYKKLAAFAQQIASLNKTSMPASEWFATLSAMLHAWQKESMAAHEAVAEQLSMLRHADGLGPLGIDDFAALLAERLATPWRDAGINTHPRIHLLTPVEARLQHFDRVILANMQEQQWPGNAPISPWLNLAAQRALGLSAPEERITRMAHDVLMLASSGQVFLTYPKRDGGSPVPRSRFIERLVTLLAVHGVTEESITASHYTQWAALLYASDGYSPEPPIRPLPEAAQRPASIAVTAIDKLFTDPFYLYARYVLGLRALDALDADPEMSDFGTLTHRALEQLTAHWNTTNLPASDAQLELMAGAALRTLDARPNIDLFWRNRLVGGLRYINQLEAKRRVTAMEVLPEQTIEASLLLGAAGESTKSIRLHGRIDRMEKTPQGTTIIDYKTGNIPSRNAILEGKSLQMLAYAMLLEGTGQTVLGLEYWQLPKLGEVGRTLPVMVDEIPQELPEKLRAALAQMLNAETPFLARPLGSSSDDGYTNDYDGISRFDEWAG